jgi:hypothetical protein
MPSRKNPRRLRPQRPLALAVKAMTTSRIIILSAVLNLGLPSAHAMAADGWGASWSFGPSTSRIIYAKTTLVPGRLPPITSSTGPLFLWPGMSNSKGDLIQTTMDAWPDNASYCGAGAGQWCVEASVFGSFGQRNGPTVAIDPDDHVTIEYTLEADGNTWAQTVTSQKRGKVVSTLQSASGPMPGTGFGFATEADADSFTIDTQYYLCTELDFAEADPHFGSTGVGANGAKYGATGMGSGAGTAKNVRTPDGGLTWLVDLITLPAMQPQGTQTPPPAISCPIGGAGDGGSGHAASSGGNDASVAGGGSGSSGAGSSGAASGGTASSTGGASSGGSTGGGTGASSGSRGGGSGGTGASGSGASSSGDSGALAGSDASSSGDASPSSTANGSEASGCSCALVGANTETTAGLSAIALGLAATFVRRRRTTRQA